MARPAISAICATVSLILFPLSAHAAEARFGPNTFGSAVLAANVTPYDARWSQVQSQTLGSGQHIAKAARAMHGIERLSFVNKAVNTSIRYREDGSNWGQNDYWASAAQSFARGSGDCEDYAIAKMQVLRASGVPSRDLYLVIGNDAVARGGHAVLVVRITGKYLVLDNFHDVVRADSDYGDFRPVITLSSAGKWLHGYKSGGQSPPTYTAANGGAAKIGKTSSLTAVVAAQVGR